MLLLRFDSTDILEILEYSIIGSLNLSLKYCIEMCYRLNDFFSTFKILSKKSTKNMVTTLDEAEEERCFVGLILLGLASSMVFYSNY